MRLPSFRAPYLFLCRAPLDVVHECLRIRLEQKPEQPSELSIRQLMRECKEALRLAVIERQVRLEEGFYVEIGNRSKLGAYSKRVVLQQPLPPDANSKRFLHVVVLCCGRRAILHLCFMLY